MEDTPQVEAERLQPVVSVILCAYTERRWGELVAAIASLHQQTRPPEEILVVIDHNPVLFERARQEFPGVIVIENQQAKGLSGARNSGMAASHGEILAFLDDDAAAQPDWLETLLQGYAEPAVIGVGGAILPHWQGGRPGWFPEEFNWVVGCTYQGMPEQPAPVRNLIGANMSFRREVFTATYGFQTGLGRVGTLPLGCEETELCIRTRQRLPDRIFFYEPGAVVRHEVPAGRGSLRYFLSRCFSEGVSKAAVSKLVGAQDGLSSERAYTLRTLPAGVLRGLADGLRGRISGVARAAAIVLGLGVTGLGYLWGRSGASGISWPRLTGRQKAASVAIPVTGRPRILMVTPRFFPEIGGVESHVYQVARRLANERADVTVLTTDRSGLLPKEEEMEGIHIRRVPAWPKSSDLYIAPGVAQAVRNGGWDLVHIQSYHTFVPPLAMLAALRSRIPYVVTFHGGGHSSRLRNAIRGMQRRLLRPLLRRAARLVAVANFEIRQYGQELGVPPERFALIPNGADLPVVTQPAARPEGALIASVGRLERYKGHQRIIAAMPFILKEKPDARLWIAGSGPYEPELRSLAERLGVQEKVKIQAVPAADREAMAAALSQAALFVLLSEFETHPVAVLEAVSLGVPALVADTSGLSELAGQGLARSLPLTSTNQEIAEAVVDQLNHPWIPPVVKLQTWDACAQQLMNLYAEILTLKPEGRLIHANFDAHSILPTHPGRD